MKRLITAVLFLSGLILAMFVMNNGPSLQVPKAQAANGCGFTVVVEKKIPNAVIYCKNGLNHGDPRGELFLDGTSYCNGDTLTINFGSCAGSLEIVGFICCTKPSDNILKCDPIIMSQGCWTASWTLKAECSPTNCLAEAILNSGTQYCPCNAE